jgi:D-alanyl-D-alanine carboxypeptidase
VLGAYSGASRAQKAAQLLERGFNGGGLSWLTPSLGTVDALAPVDAQPPNLREEMCGGHRRKPASEDNDEEEPAEAAANSESDQAAPSGGQAFMLSSLRPANGKFVLGPPVETSAPVVVFTGPSNSPDKAAQTGTAAAKKKKKLAAKPPSDSEPPAAAAKTEKPAKTANPVKPAKPKVSAAAPSTTP